MGSPPARICAGAGLTPCHNYAASCDGTGLTPATSAPGPGSPRRGACHSPHLRRDRAHPCYIRDAAGVAPPTSAPGPAAEIGGLCAGGRSVGCARKSRRVLGRPDRRGPSAHPCPHLRCWTHSAHICAGTGLTPSHIGAGTWSAVCCGVLVVGTTEHACFHTARLRWARMARMGGGPTLGRNGIPYHSPRTGRTAAGAWTSKGTDNRSKGY